MPQPIKGYRDLSPAEIFLINRIKEKAEEVSALCEEVKQSESPDLRWLAIGITNLQQGFMAVNRAVAKPTTF